jgi:hypothetical protein
LTDLHPNGMREWRDAMDLGDSASGSARAVK